MCWNVINNCIGKLNAYKVDMEIEYYDGFYMFEMKKRFPNIKWNRIENPTAVVQSSLAMDFYILWCLVVGDEDYFKEELLPNFEISISFLSNIRAFAYEMPELFTTYEVYHRLELLIGKYEQDLKGYSFIDKIKAKRLVTQYKQFL